jgi:hypothetical protein
MRLKHSIGLAVCALVSAAPAALAVIPVTDVLPGYDLFESIAGTQFMGEPFEGVPIGSYNFGGSIGVQNTGPTDTIVQRLATASVPIPSLPNTASPISIQLDDLQLVSATPYSFGGGPVGYYYITTQSQDSDGPVSTGSMSIEFDSTAGGTFTSSLDVFFDVHYGALNGPLVYQSDLLLSNSGDAWGRVPPPGAVLINGANYLLNGVDDTEDFFVNPPLIESHPSGAGTHVVQEAQVPEPATMGLAAVAGMLLLSRRRRSAI